MHSKSILASNPPGAEFDMVPTLEIFVIGQSRHRDWSCQALSWAPGLRLGPASCSLVQDAQRDAVSDSDARRQARCLFAYSRIRPT